MLTKAALLDHLMLYIEGVKGEVQSLASYTDSASNVHVIVAHNTSGNKRSGANYLTTFTVTEEIMRGLIIVFPLYFSIHKHCSEIFSIKMSIIVHFNGEYVYLNAKHGLYNPAKITLDLIFFGML